MSEPKTLPVPSSTRWKPLRGGLLNLYLYDDQEFLYEGGRLLLRGNNGTGKSRVLALQLPFLLDGQVSASRVEPDGDPARRIEWHLLMGTRYPARTGYTWIEFGRRDDDGVARTLTLGIGLEALQGKGLKRRWYFVTDLRVGESLSLTGPQGTALGPKELDEALVGRGEVYDHADAYRAEVDRRLFGLGKERYDALLELLLGLRRPQLSRRLDEKNLSEALSLALPPLSSATLGDVADAFRQLESDRAELERYRVTARTAKDFEKLHSRYVGIEGKRRAAEVRTAHSRYEAIGREKNDTGSALEGARAEEDGLEASAVELRRTAKELEAREHALRTSDEMRAAERLRALEASVRHARAALEAAEKREGRARNLRSAAAERARRAEDDRSEAASLLSDAVRDVAEATKDARVALELPPLSPENTPTETDALLARLDAVADREGPAAIERRRAQLAHLRRLEADEAKAREAVARAEAKVASERAHFESAAAARAEAASTHERAAEALLDEVTRFRASLAELRLDPASALEEAMREWTANPSGPAPIALAADRAARERATAMHGEKAAAEATLAALTTERASRATERAALVAGTPPTPEPLPGRARQAREASDGGALWALCDFRPEVPAEERARLEAALEASGLLDAFVAAEGPVRVGLVDDVYLLPDAAPAGPSLADVLFPSPDPASPRAMAVGEARILAVLRSVGLGESAHTAWIDRDGAYRLGPLRGRHQKESAQFVGHGAREAERRRRLAALDAAIAELDARIEIERSRIDASKATLDAIERERSRTPDGASVRTSALLLAEREKVEATKRESLAEAGVARDLAAEELDRKRSARAEAAESYDLAEGAPDLATLERALDGLRHRLLALRDRVRALRRALGTVESVRAELDGAAADHESALAATADAKTHLAVQAAEHEALASAVGASARAVLDRLAEVQANRDENAKAQDANQNALRAQAEKTGALAEALARLEVELAAQTSRRGLAADELRALLATGALRGLDTAFEGGEAITASSMTRVVELARALEKTTGDLPEGKDARERSERAVHENVRAVQDALAGQHYSAQLEFRASVHVLRTTHQGRELDLAELLAHLDGEVENRERILAEDERRVIEKYLVDALANEIFHAIQNADDIVLDMNREVERCRLSTGMALRFKWRPLPDLGARWAACEKVFRRAPSLWTAHERESVADFLQERIASAQTEHAALPPAERLALALDYRRFHGFEIEREQDGEWKRLTRRTHGTGSGGEKAIALTLPQLAAAAAHYRNVPLAPRFILLDEAFVGIDADAREKCMGMIESLDLDLVMTSEREWGCYPTLGALSIYQLSTKPGIDAVLATRFVWNGKELRRVDV